VLRPLDEGFQFVGGQLAAGAQFTLGDGINGGAQPVRRTVVGVIEGGQDGRK
jgi:hypothetical protein